MYVAKIDNFSNLNKFLTFYKLKVIVSRRGSYGGFGLWELNDICRELGKSKQTIVSHIKFLLKNRFLVRDTTNRNHIRVSEAFKRRRSNGFIEDEVLMALDLKRFKSFLMELRTESHLKGVEFRAKFNLREAGYDRSVLDGNLKSMLGKHEFRKKEFNGAVTGRQLSPDYRPISCSYQGFKIGKHKSTVSRWRKVNSLLYSNRIEVTDIPPEALKSVKKTHTLLYNQGILFLNRLNKVCYQYISIRKNTFLSRSEKCRKISPLPMVAEIKN